nr:PREDICTED: CMRF35-like molecule 5 isoform X2 [Lepisosteus oculatus]
MKSEEKGCSSVASMRYLITNHHQRRIRLGLGCVTSAERRVSGSEGGSVEIRCDYPDGYQYKEKYWCRHPCGNKDVLIKTGKTDTVVSVGRFSLFVNISVRTFTVTMSRLTLQDTGVYYCGLEQWGPDKYTEMLLRVTEHTQAMTVSILSTSMPVTVLMDITKTAAMDSSTQSAGGQVMFGVSLAVVLCVFVLAAVILWIKRPGKNLTSLAGNTGTAQVSYVNCGKIVLWSIKYLCFRLQRHSKGVLEQVKGPSSKFCLGKHQFHFCYPCWSQ